VQAPALPGSAHDRQVPVHALAQQIPCSQKPDWHSTALPQVPPGGFLPQLPLMQLLGATQSASLAQMTRHLPSVPQPNGAHDCPGVDKHTPAPSHRNADVSVEPVHAWGLHIAPDEYFSHAPAPSQTPSVPQLAAPLSAHSLRGSVPRSAGRQVPRLPAAAQVRHTSVQALLQQTPSAQKPLAQSLVWAHGRPSGRPGVPPPPSPPRSTDPSPPAPAPPS
jgi:hypothetical protein